jgi:hypothetical protein
LCGSTIDTWIDTKLKIKIIMDLNKLLLGFMFGVFTTYIVSIYLKYGVLKSISASYYKIRHKSEFTLFMWSLAFTVIIVGSTGWMFLCGAGLAFVGAAAAFEEEKTTRLVHMVGAVVGITAGFISLWLDFDMFAFIPIMIACSGSMYFITLIFKSNTFIWWVEILSFVLIFIGLIIK